MIFDDSAVSPSSKDLLAVLIPLLELSFGPSPSPSPSPPISGLVLQLNKLCGLRGLTLVDGQDRDLHEVLNACGVLISLAREGRGQVSLLFDGDNGRVTIECTAITVGCGR